MLSHHTEESGGEVVLVGGEVSLLCDLVSPDAIDKLIAAQCSVHEQWCLPGHVDYWRIVLYETQL